MGSCPDTDIDPIFFEKAPSSGNLIYFYCKEGVGIYNI